MKMAMAWSLLVSSAHAFSNQAPVSSQRNGFRGCINKMMHATTTTAKQKTGTTMAKHRLSVEMLMSSSATTSDNDSDATKPKLLSPRLNNLDRPTVWHEFSPLAVQHEAVNLGQGFPDWDPPQFVQNAMMKSMSGAERNAHQYARSQAHLPLAKILAQEYSKRWDIDIDPTTMVGTAVGCTNALFCALQGLVGANHEQQDEVLLLEPAFDIYTAQVQMAGGKPIYCPLRTKNDGDETSLGASQRFTLDMDELESKITPQTKVLILNTPHNPTGKMFSREELTQMASVLQRHPQVTVISDEVYEHIVFDTENEPHISMASIPGMWERTLTLSSSGKTFSCTGWKVGWAIGPPSLVRAMAAVQQWCNFSVPTPNQDAIAQALEEARKPFRDEDQVFDSYYSWLASEYKRKRSILMEALEHADMSPICPPGAFFIMADTSHIQPAKLNDIIQSTKTPAMPTDPMPRDWAFSRWMTEEIGVTAIPPCAFYSPENIPLAKNLLRFAFCKDDGTLLEAKKRFETYFSKQ